MRPRPFIALSLALLGSAGLVLTACHSGRIYSSAPHRSEAPRAPHDAGGAPVDRDGYRRDIRSGTLTAGYFDDAEDTERFAEWSEEVSMLGPDHGFVDGFDQSAIQITVLNNDGDPIHNAEVGVIDGYQRASRVSVKGRTGTDGRVVLIPEYDALRHGKLKLSIDAPGTQSVVRSIHAEPGDSVEVTLDRARSEVPRRLDLALVIDTTGSMGDELEYLKVEFRDIVERIADRYPHVDQRWSLVVYRDTGDRYVVRDYDFTGSLRRMIDRLGEQRADGGGDYPEAVDQALREATRLGWREDAAKVAFLIADAPPHPNRAPYAMRMAQHMRGLGVALYPVASSGVRAEAEHFFRSAALITGGGYSFLTDDSGVGNPHADPHDAPAYSVQQLDDLMVRLVKSELAGEARTPRRRDIVREVPDRGDGQQRQADEGQVRAWRDRRARLVELLESTDLSEKTARAIEDEITMLDRRIRGAGH